MKSVKYSLNDTDIEAITFALSILPSLHLEDDELQAAINSQLCESAGVKLLGHNFNISANEGRVISCALQAVQLINTGDLPVSSSSLKEKCKGYLFTVNKLVSVFGL